MISICMCITIRVFTALNLSFCGCLPMRMHIFKMDFLSYMGNVIQTLYVTFSPIKWQLRETNLSNSVENEDNSIASKSDVGATNRRWVKNCLRTCKFHEILIILTTIFSQLCIAILLPLQLPQTASNQWIFSLDFNWKKRQTYFWKVMNAGREKKACVKRINSSLKTIAHTTTH